MTKKVNWRSNCSSNDCLYCFYSCLHQW